MHESRRAQLRSALAVLGAATLLVGGVQLIATAATGGPLVLGGSNTASNTTKLKTTGNKAALKLKSKAGKPALAVSNKALIKNLNADLIDGKSLEQLAPTIYRQGFFTSGGTVPASPAFVASTSIPAGTYRASVSGLFAIGTGESVICQFADYTKLLANGSDWTAVLLTAWAQEDIPNLFDERIVTIVPGHQYLLGCSGDAGIDIAQAPEFLLEPVDQPTAPIPGTAPIAPKPSVVERAETLR
jgi:hypothetical protein